MKATTRRLSFLLLAVFGIVVMMATSMPTFAQGRGDGRNFDKFEKKRQKDFDKLEKKRQKDLDKLEKKRQKDLDKLERKREKFINGHDARDGRWDGRGPRTRSTDRFDRRDRRWDRRNNRWNHDGRLDRRSDRRDLRDMGGYRRQSR